MIPLIIFIAFFIVRAIVVSWLKRKGEFLWQILPGDDVIYDIPMEKKKSGRIQR